MRSLGASELLLCATALTYSAGYLYFHAAPDADAFHHECVQRVKNLHTSDCLRANKYVHTCSKHSKAERLTRSTMAWGLEARVPFLDKAFLEVALNIDAKEKMFGKTGMQELDEDGRPKIEKVGCFAALSSSSRASSTSSEKPLTARRTARLARAVICLGRSLTPVTKPYLPKSILWRQKEQFSDGVGYSWIDGFAPGFPHTPRAQHFRRVKDFTASAVSDDDFAQRAQRWPVDTPDTKEAFYIRQVFEGSEVTYGHDGVTDQTRPLPD